LRALADAREALIGYAMLHGRRHVRPADTNGEESNTPRTPADNCSGLLPAATLGISALDGWGKQLRYSVTPVFTVAPISRDTAVADKQILTRNARGTTTYLAGQAQCSVNDPCIPAVVLSTGKYNLGVDAYGLSRPTARAISTKCRMTARRRFSSASACAMTRTPPAANSMIW
jgi:hypothetical protein